MSRLDPSAIALHEQAIVFDCTCPLLEDTRFVDTWISGGCTAAAPTVASTHDPPEALAKVGRWHRLLREDRRLLHITRSDQFAEAKRLGKLGIVLHFQNTLPLGRDPDNVWAYAALGVRIIQLTYNVKNFVGDGCDERTDAGLSEFGARVIRAMNQTGIVVDLSHTGFRTTMDAMELTQATPIFSHSNVKKLHPSPRNLADEQIKRLAELGGVIGVNGFPAFVSSKPRPTLDDLIDHVAYIAELVGVAHVGLGIDFFSGMHGVCPPEQAEAQYRRRVADGIWKPAAYPPPPYYYPEGLDSPAGYPNLTARLLERGFSAEEVMQILGGNFVRVFAGVWDGVAGA